MTNSPPTQDPGRPARPILDVRPATAFEKLHRAGTVNIPLEEIARRVHELPPKRAGLTIFDTNETRARWARSRLRARERRDTDIIHGEQWLRDGLTATGPSRGRLWQPHGLLVEAVDLARRIGPDLRGRRALDVACGAGRETVYLAMCGFKVECRDILPDALAICRDLASRHGVSVKTRQQDVEADPALGRQAYDLVCCFNFLHRPLMGSIADAVRPGGLLVYETFVHPQRDLFGKPRRDSHLLKSAELPAYFADWETLISREGLTSPRRFAASLVARKPPRVRPKSSVAQASRQFCPGFFSRNPAT